MSVKPWVLRFLLHEKDVGSLIKIQVPGFHLQRCPCSESAQVACAGGQGHALRGTLCRQRDEGAGQRAARVSGQGRDQQVRLSCCGLKAADASRQLEVVTPGTPPAPQDAMA